LIPTYINEEDRKLYLIIDEKEIELKQFISSSLAQNQKASEKLNKGQYYKLYQFFQQQLLLLGNLCFGRNYFCKKIIKDKYPVALLLMYIKDL
jgi:hypothetical protein